jgi:hypothetical protein
MKILKIASPFLFLVTATILERDHPRTIPPKFGVKWPSGFRAEYFLVIVYGRTTDVKWSQRHTWSFGSDELEKKGSILFPIRGKNHGYNNNFLICNRWNGTFSEFNTPSRSPEDYIIHVHWK